MFNNYDEYKNKRINLEHCYFNNNWENQVIYIILYILDGKKHEKRK